MNILIVCNHYAVCSGRYAVDAFTRLGHNVVHRGPAQGRSIWGMQVPEQYVWKPDEFLPWHPHLTIVMDSDPAILDAYGNNGIRHPDFNTPIIVWGVDSHVRDYRRPYFDHYFLAHRSVSVMAWEHEGIDDSGSRVLGYYPNTDMTWLPCAYDPVAFPPSPIPWSERAYDVCMIGFMYPQRWALVNAMKAAGLKVLAGTGLVYEAYRDAYHNSRVALVSSACGDLPIRLFEGAGMGCAVVADKMGDLALLDQQSDSVAPVNTYDDIDGAIDAVRRILDFGDGELLATDAAEWASRHTWDARAQVICDWLEARK